MSGRYNLHWSLSVYHCQHTAAYLSERKGCRAASLPWRAIAGTIVLHMLFFSSHELSSINNESALVTCALLMITRDSRRKVGKAPSCPRGCHWLEAGRFS